jgi:hypothetical protein
LRFLIVSKKISLRRLASASGSALSTQLTP